MKKYQFINKTQIFSLSPGLYTTFFVFPVKLSKSTLCKLGEACNACDEDLGSKTRKEYGGLKTCACLGEGGFLNWTKLAHEVHDDVRLRTGGKLLVCTRGRKFLGTLFLLSSQVRLFSLVIKKNSDVVLERNAANVFW